MPYEYINENSSRYIPDESKGEVDYEKKRKKAGNTNEALGNVPAYDANGISTSRDNLMNYATGGMYASKSTGNTDSSSKQYNQNVPKVTDNTDLINKQNDTALQSTIASIKAAVQQAKAKQTQIIQKAPEQYGNLKNVVYGQSLAALPGMRENTANLGASDQGGYSRTTETRANSELMNRLGELDRQKQSVIDEANFTIADLESQGMMQEANATKESALAKLQQIVAESSRLDSLNSSNYWNAEQMSQDNYWKNVNQSNYQQQASTAQTQQEWENKYKENSYADAEEQQVWENAFREKGFSAEQANAAAQIAIAQQNANTSAYRASEGSSVTQSSLTGKTNNDDAIIEIENQLERGTAPGDIAYSIEKQRASLKKQGINVDALIKQVWEMAGISTKPESEDSWR
jgi:hypothetical protein